MQGSFHIMQISESNKLTSTSANILFEVGVCCTFAWVHNWSLQNTSDWVYCIFFQSMYPRWSYNINVTLRVTRIWIFDIVVKWTPPFREISILPLAEFLSPSKFRVTQRICWGKNLRFTSMNYTYTCHLNWFVLYATTRVPIINVRGCALDRPMRSTWLEL